MVQPTLDLVAWQEILGIGSGTWIRTTDPLINSQLLYR